MKVKSSKRFLAALLFVLCAGSAAVRAQEPTPSEALVVTDGRSPDGTKELTITDETDEALGSGPAATVRVRDRRTGRVSGYFSWSGYGRHAGADSLKVLWQPDNLGFAISYLLAHGYVSCSVYVLVRDGSCHEVQLPGYVAQVARKYGYTSGIHGGEHPRRWLSHDRLVIEVANRGWEHELTPGGYVGETYLVTLKIIRRNRHPSAVVTGIRPAPASED